MIQNQPGSFVPLEYTPPYRIGGYVAYRDKKPWEVALPGFLKTTALLALEAHLTRSDGFSSCGSLSY